MTTSYHPPEGEGEDEGEGEGEGDEPELGAESTWAMVRRFRRELPPKPTLEEAIACLDAELPLVVQEWPGDHDLDPDETVPVLGRRTGLEVDRSGRMVRFVATYHGAIVAKTVTFELTFRARRLVRHARQRFADVHGFSLDEVFAIDEVLLHTVDWWTPGEERFSWP